MSDTGRVTEDSASHAGSPNAHDDRRCGVPSIALIVLSSTGACDCWCLFLPMFFRKHRNAARMKESSTIEASKDRKIEELEGGLKERGKEKETSDMGIELAGI